MDWKKERDALIAQTLAFVQSVSGKSEETRRTETRTSDAAPDIEAALIDAINDTTIEPIRIVEPPKDIHVTIQQVNIQASRTSSPSDFRTEIQSRVANFRAHQERFNREREEYFSATLGKARAAVRDDSAPLRDPEAPR